MPERTPSASTAALIKPAQAQLETLGQAWTALGATEFSVYSPDGDCLWHYPPERQETTSSTGERETLSVPLKVGHQVFGDLRVDLQTTNQTPALEQRLQADAVLITRVLKLETEMGEMTVELINTQDQQLAFFKLARSVSSQIDIDGIMQTLAREAVSLVKTESGFLILHHGDDYYFAQFPPNYIEKGTLFEAFDPVRRSGRAQLFGQPQMPDAINNLYMMPITIEGKVLAGLGLINKAPEFTAPDLTLARAIAEEAGVHIERVLLHVTSLQQARLTIELDMAAQIQSQLLPQHTPRVAGLDIHGRLIQARQVGGDFYVFAKPPEQGFVFAVGDVAGKGVSSALMMAITRTVIHSHATMLPALETGEILTLANSELYVDYTRVNMFTTIFVGCYLPETQKLYYSNAGHSPVMFCPAGGKAELIRAQDLPLGVLPDHVYGSETITLNPGDVLVVATDGFNEAHNDSGEMYGYERLLALVERHAKRSAQTIAEVMIASIHTFSAGHPQDDDETIVVVKGVPPRPAKEHPIETRKHSTT